jgi:outer membrane protein
MKNTNYIISGILALAIVVLFILQFTGGNAVSKDSVAVGVDGDSENFHLPLAYIRTDSLLGNYQFSIDLNEELIKKVEDRRLTISQREERFRRDANDFYQKVQNNIFVTQERFRQEQERLARQEQDLQNYVAEVERELMLEQSRMSQQVHDTIVAALKDFNQPKKYEFILSNVGTDNLFYADDVYDITQAVVEFLNARYAITKR